MSTVASSEPAKNYWGDQPEEEFYASQGVRNEQSYFEGKNGRLFTQKFEPLDTTVVPIKASVYMSHGYGSDTGWMFQKIAIAFARWGYAVFCADLYGHGRSDGIRCYLGDMEMVAGNSLAFFSQTRQSPSYAELPAFLFGESMGGAATMLMYFQSPPGLWTGLIFSAPLFIIPENMKPPRMRIFMYGLLLGLADTWQVMPDNKMVEKAVKDPDLLKIIAANPRRYTEKARVGTMRELTRVCEYIQGRMKDVDVPFLTAHGTDDGLASAAGSEWLHERAKSEDKSIKLYPGMYHSLIQGEPDVNSQKVLADMKDWIDNRVQKYGGGGSGSTS
ncbi:Caffeoylshikimate esterase [Zostera marina]|uniref:Caffeoylshikimate esterase n=1 Tax=Zostera marina TaxID=29655 RepID=A0A0K9P0W1_ZOSMR|nr:Caffeoylshikimate esterase [Zostera marina]